MTDRELMQQALEALEVLDRVVLGTRRAEEAITDLRERLAQPEFDSALQSAAKTQTATKLEQAEQECCQDTAQCLSAGVCVAKHGQQPEQSPLDRMAENARELGLDYEPVQEPVAWMDKEVGAAYLASELDANDDCAGLEPLYTAPPRREWQGLTEEEIDPITQAQWGWNAHGLHDAYRAYVRAIEAKLREKNT